MVGKSSNTPKAMFRKGLWSPEEDNKLKIYIFQYGHGRWSSLPSRAGLQRNGKSCRLRWINYLKPGLKRGAFSTQEDEIILALHRLFGNKWSRIAQQVPGRTDNEIKNYWHSYLKKKVIKAEGLQAETKFHSRRTTSTSQSLQPHQTERSFPMFLLGEDSIEHTNRKCFPRVLFSEWLSPEHVQLQNYNYPCYQMEIADNSLEDSDISSIINSDYAKRDYSYNNSSVPNAECSFMHDEETFFDEVRNDLNNDTSLAKFETDDFLCMAETLGDYNLYGHLFM